METMLDLLTTGLTKLKYWLNSYNSPCGMPTAWHNIQESWKHFISVHNFDIMLISDTLHWKKLSKTSQRYSLSFQSSRWNVLRWHCYNNKKFHRASPTKLQSKFPSSIWCVDIRLSQSLNNFGCWSSTQIHSTARAIRFLQYPRVSVHCRRRLQC
jgi:hypothetical protein